MNYSRRLSNICVRALCEPLPLFWRILLVLTMLIMASLFTGLFWLLITTSWVIAAIVSVATLLLLVIVVGGAERPSPSPYADRHADQETPDA